MGANTKIQWCDYTFNPWEGCTKVSAGCAHCYAEARNARFGGGKAPNWGEGALRRRTSVHNWNEPRRWEKRARRAMDCVLCHNTRKEHASGPYKMPGGACWYCYGWEKNRPRVFCASLADWLDYEVLTQWRVDLLALIAQTPHLEWLLLTKRPESWNARMHEAMGAGSVLAREWLNGTPPANVQVGISVEDNAALERIEPWLAISARRRFISAEPLLELVDFGLRNYAWPDGARPVHQVIVGGESGPDSRPFDLQWARFIVADCHAAGVAAFVKQLGALPCDSRKADEDAGLYLKDKKGGDMAEWPEELRVREFPG